MEFVEIIRSFIHQKGSSMSLGSNSALVTGCSGQDGAYLSQMLLGLGYKVIGSTRSKWLSDFWRLKELGVLDHPNFRLVELDSTSLQNCEDVIKEYDPSEVYNLASQSFIPTSQEKPHATLIENGMGPLNLLEAIRIHKPICKYFQASSSDMYAAGQTVRDSLLEQVHPRSPYATSKLYGHWITNCYREEYGLFAVSGVLFNHESPLRSPHFITRKISRFVAELEQGLSQPLRLGDLDSERDFGYAPDFVRGMFGMLQGSEANNFVLATGDKTSIRSFFEKCLAVVGRRVIFSGSGDSEIGVDEKSGSLLVLVSPQLRRDGRAQNTIRGDSSKAFDAFGWQPSRSIQDIAREMVEADINRLARVID